LHSILGETLHTLASDVKSKDSVQLSQSAVTVLPLCYMFKSTISMVKGWYQEVIVTTIWYATRVPSLNY